MFRNYFCDISKNKYSSELYKILSSCRHETTFNILFINKLKTDLYNRVVRHFIRSVCEEKFL